MNKILSEARQRNLVEAVSLWGKVFQGNLRARADIVEALSTSDFQLATGDMLDRELLTRYQSLTPVWRGFAKATTVKDFKVKHFIDLMGGISGLERVPELSEYPAERLDRQTFPISIGKFGRRFEISWEQVVNDDLGEYQSLPDLLAQSARNAEDRAAVEVLATKAGPNTALFKAANGNAVDNKPLTRANLEAALQKVSQREDANGNPIMVTGYVLVIPPGLQMTADAILSASEIRDTDADGTITTRRNTIGSRVRVVVNPWLPIVDRSSKAAATWYLVPDPAGARPAVAVAHLRGHEQPDLRLYNVTGQRVGGGAISPLEGSFDIDSIQYRVRLPLGAAAIDPAGTYASTGS